jgi:dihydrofolate synthase/folylpolyglutamate synthase
MLASVLRWADYRAGLFTSPHLVDVRERIEINGAIISRDDVAALMAEIRPAVEALEAEGQPPTFFEVGTALGFMHFVRRGCDIAVIEVGLGGRFDSTNVITPLVSVITSISLDHTQILGDRVEQIAFEKAGIIKPGVPVVSGVTDPAARAVIERVAAERGSPLVQLGVDFHYKIGYYCLNYYHLPDFRAKWVDYYAGWRKERLSLHPGLEGEHQAANSAVAVAVVDQLTRSGLAIPDKDIETGIRLVHWPARLEVFGSNPRAVLDCAHNVASAKALVTTLIHSYLPRDRVLIFAASNDKDVPGMFRVLTPHFRRFYLTRYQQSTRGVPPEQLAAWLPEDKERVICPTPADAWRAASAAKTLKTLIVIAGSVFLAGELRPLLVQASQSRQP